MNAYEITMAKIEADLASGKISEAEAMFLRRWADETVAQATAMAAAKLKEN